MRFQMLNWRFGGAFAFSGLILAAVFALNYEPRYITTADLDCMAADGTNPEAFKLALQGLHGNLTARKTLFQVIQDPRISLYPRQRAYLPLEDVAEQMRRDFRFETSSLDARRIQIHLSLTGTDRDRIQPALESLVKRTFAEHTRLRQPAPHNPLNGSHLEVRVPPSPVQSTGATRPGITLSGIGLGALASFLFALVRRFSKVCFLCGAIAFTLGVCSLAIPLPYEAKATLATDTLDRRTQIFESADIAMYWLHAVPPPRLVPDQSGSGFAIIVRDPVPIRAQRTVQDATNALMRGFTRRHRQPAPGDEPLLGVVAPPALPRAPIGNAWRTTPLVAGFALATLAGLCLLLDRRRYFAPSPASSACFSR